jgi:TetR/AcrR family fatty acid metabolism transcriptional regulator
MLTDESVIKTGLNMPKIIDKKAKKLEILHAAAKVFAEKGVVKTKMVDIASEAGIGKGTIYEYYRSKEEIFGDTFRLIFDHMELQIAEAIGHTQDPVVKLRKLIQVTLKEFLEHSGDLAGIMMDFWAEGIRSKNNDVLSIINLELVYSEYKMLIADILHDGMKKGIFREVDANSLAAIIIGSMDQKCG